MSRGAMMEFKVGIFVTAGLLLAMITIFMLGGEHKLFKRQYTLYASFEDIAGLRVGAPVQLAGLKVGLVDSISIPRDMEQRVIVVDIKIDREYQRRIRADSEAAIETQGLLGDKFIHISMGSESEPVLKDGDVIATKPTASLFALADKAGDIMDNIDKASKSIREMLDSFTDEKGESDIKQIAASIRKIVDQAEKGKGLVHALFFDPAGGQVVSDLARAMKALGDVVEQADKDGAPGLLVNMRHATADLRSLIGSIRRGEGTLGKLITDPALYEDMRALVGRANRNVLMRSVIRSTIQENERQVLQ